MMTVKSSDTGDAGAGEVACVADGAGTGLPVVVGVVSAMGQIQRSI
jgi:hypothetical protein